MSSPKKSPQSRQSRSFSSDSSSLTIARSSLSAYIFCCRSVEAAQWIKDCLTFSNIPSPDLSPSSPDLRDALYSGIYLCQLMKLFSPKSVKKVHQKAKILALAAENHTHFCNGCKSLKMDPDIIYSPIDILESKNLPRFVATIHSLCDIVMNNGWQGPSIITKEGHVRFSAPQLSQAQDILDSLQNPTRNSSTQTSTPDDPPFKKIIQKTMNRLKTRKGVTGRFGLKNRLESGTSAVGQVFNTNLESAYAKKQNSKIISTENKTPSQQPRDPEPEGQPTMSKSLFTKRPLKAKKSTNSSPTTKPLSNPSIISVSRSKNRRSISAAMGINEYKEHNDITKSQDSNISAIPIESPEHNANEPDTFTDYSQTHYFLPFRLFYQASESVSIILMQNQWHQQSATSHIKKSINSAKPNSESNDTDAVLLNECPVFIENILFTKLIPNEDKDFWETTIAFPLELFEFCTHFEYKFLVDGTHLIIDSNSPLMYVPPWLPPRQNLPSRPSISKLTKPSTSTKKSSFFSSFFSYFDNEHNDDTNDNENTDGNCHDHGHGSRHTSNQESSFSSPKKIDDSKLFSCLFPTTLKNQDFIGHSKYHYDPALSAPQSSLAVNRQFLESPCVNIFDFDLSSLTVKQRQKSFSTNQLFTWGSNEFGQIGLYDTFELDFTQGENDHSRTHLQITSTPTTPGPLTKRQITGISIFDRTAIVSSINSQGKIEFFAWGNNDFGQCSAPSSSVPFIKRPYHIDFGNITETPSLFSAASRYSAFIIRDELLITLNTSIQTPLDTKTKTKTKIKTKTSFNPNHSLLQEAHTGYSKFSSFVLPFNPTSIVSGYSHSLILSNTGYVYGFGSNVYNQALPSPDADFLNWIEIPQRILLPEKIILISAGFSHSLALSETGKLYAWGHNVFGVCGTSCRINTASSSPFLDVNDTKSTPTIHWVPIASSQTHNPALITPVLKNGTTFSVLTRPVSVHSFPNFNKNPILSVSSSYFHSVAVSSGTIYVWGKVDSPGLGLIPNSHKTQSQDRPDGLVDTLHLVPFVSQPTNLMDLLEYLSTTNTTEQPSTNLAILQNFSFVNVSTSPWNFFISAKDPQMTTIVNNSSTLEQYTLFSFGSDTFGSLGIGDPISQQGYGINLRKIQVPESLPLSNIFDIGDQFSLIVDTFGTCYSFGKSELLGTSISDWGGAGRRVSTPISLKSFSPAGIVAAKAKFNVSGALTSNGRIFIWGSNDNLHQIAPTFAKSSPKTQLWLKSPPHRIDLLDSIIQFDFGLDFVFALDSIGKVYSWGSNPAINSSKPQVMDWFVNNSIFITQIACGLGHVLFLDSAGELWIWGTCGFGEDNTTGYNSGQQDMLDSSITSPNINEPILLESLALDLAANNDSILQIDCGFYNSAVLTCKGKVYCWGGGFVSDSTISSRQLQTSINKPKELKFSSQFYATSKKVASKFPIPPDTGNNNQPKIIKISSGAYHITFLLDNGTVAGFGVNTKGQCGTSDTQIKSPKIVSLTVPMSDISSGEFHTLAVSFSGHLWGWGQNLMSSLYLQAEDSASSSASQEALSGSLIKPTVIFDSPKHLITQCTAGRDYGIFLATVI